MNVDANSGQTGRILEERQRILIDQPGPHVHAKAVEHHADPAGGRRLRYADRRVDLRQVTARENRVENRWGQDGPAFDSPNLFDPLLLGRRHRELRELQRHDLMLARGRARVTVDSLWAKRTKGARGLIRDSMNRDVTQIDFVCGHESFHPRSSSAASSRAASKTVEQLRCRAKVRLLQTVQGVGQCDQALDCGTTYHTERSRHRQSPFAGGLTTLPLIK